MTININSNKVYNDFFKHAGVTVAKPSKSTEPTASVKVGEITEPDNTTSKSNKKKLFGIIGISAGSALLLGIITIFTVSKGFSGSVTNKLNNISASAKRKIFELTSQTKNLNLIQKITLRLNKAIQKIAESLKASANFSAAKDSFVLQCLKKMKMTGIANSINNFFKKITLKTKNEAYKNAEYSAVDFHNYLKKLAQNCPNKEQATILENKADLIMQKYMEHFASNKHMERSETIWHNLSNLHEEVYGTLFNKKLFKNLKSLDKYITAELIAPQRTRAYHDIATAKSEISNSLKDMDVILQKALANLKININPNNTESVQSIKNISALFDTKKIQNIGVKEFNRTQIHALITQNLDELTKIIKKDCKTKQELEILQSKIDELKSLLSPQAEKKGLVQEALSDIKTIFGGKTTPEYQGAKKLANKLNEKLNTAINYEDTVYEKLAEMQVGSAPSDVVGILGPTALGTFLVIDSESKEERITDTLTKGIPILGGVGTTYYGTTRGFTGVKNLVLGLSTGYILNILGTEADKLLKRYMKEQAKLKKAFEDFTKMQRTGKV